MRKLIAAINMTLDGFCDHTAMDADDETHAHYNELLRSAGALIYGRITYQLMESYWPSVVQQPTGNKQTDDFAVLIDDIPKVVFSRTLEAVHWKNVRLATGSIAEEISALKSRPGKDLVVGSPSMIVATANLGLVDEYQVCVHPVIAGKGLPLFKDISDRIGLQLLKTKTFSCGAVILYYEPAKAAT